MLAITVTINKNNFQLKRAPRFCFKKGLVLSSGSAASKVPAGQMYLQKAGEPTPTAKKKTSGRMMTKSRPIMYLSLVSVRVAYF